MSDRLSNASDHDLERALTALGSALPAPKGVGLLDRVEEELSEGSGHAAGSRQGRRTLPPLVRRLGVAALALAVAGAGTYVGVRAFTRTHRTPLAVSLPENFHALWPEQDGAAAAAEQERVNQGQDAWRKDLNEVATRFAHYLLGPNAIAWGAAGTEFCIEPAPGPGCPISFEGPDTQGTAGAASYVRLDQLVQPGRGGIWSVTRIDGTWFTSDVTPGDRVEVPGTWSPTVEVNLPKNTVTYSAIVGIPGSQCPAREQGLALANGGRIAVKLSDAILTCRGGARHASVDGILMVYATNPTPPDVFGPRLPLPLLSASAAAWGVVPGSLVAVPVRFVGVADPKAADYHVMWPELDYRDAVAAQERADAGDPRLAWRLVPDEVAKRAVRALMGQVAASVGPDPNGTGGDIASYVTDTRGHHELVLMDLSVRSGRGAILGVTAIYGDVSITDGRVTQDHATVRGKGAPPGAQLQIDIVRRGSAALRVVVSADAQGAFTFDASGPSVPPPGESGYVSVAVVGPGTTFLDLTIAYLPP